jgi:hypothetical protein
MAMQLTHCRRAFVPGATLVAVFLITGCASPVVDVQWRNVETPANYLRGASVLVSCETPDFAIKHVCEDQLMADLSARGAAPTLAAPETPAQPGTGDAQYLPSARSIGAKAVLSVTVGLSSERVDPGMQLSIGGFGFGRYSAAGVGVSAPVGGGQVTAGYSANGRVTDVASGRLMWTARASTSPSSDVNAQMAELSKSVLDAAGKAGLF